MLSKVIWDCSRLALFHSVIFPEKSCHFLNQSNVNLKPIAIRLLPRVFPRLEQFACCYSESLCDVFLFVVWRCDSFGVTIFFIRSALLPLNLISRVLSLPPKRKCFLEGKRERALVTRLYYYYVSLQCGFERRLK